MRDRQDHTTPKAGRLRHLGTALRMGLLIMLSSHVVNAQNTDIPFQASEVRSLGGVPIHHRLHVSESDESTVTLVLVHGWSCDSSYWDAQLAELITRHDVLTVDLAGHGRSPGWREDLSIAAFGTDVARAVEQALPTGAVILVGHSMGGPVALEAALQLGPRVRAVIGVDTFKNIGAPPPDPAQVAARLQFFAADFAGATRTFVEQTFFREDADPTLKLHIAADMSSGDPAVGIAAIRALNDWDGVQTLRQLKQKHPHPLPILAINARHGSPTDLARLQGFYANFRLLEMDGVGHFLMLEQPQRFNSLLLQEIARMSMRGN